MTWSPAALTSRANTGVKARPMAIIAVRMPGEHGGEEDREQQRRDASISRRPA